LPAGISQDALGRCPRTAASVSRSQEGVIPCWQGSESLRQKCVKHFPGTAGTQVEVRDPAAENFVSNFRGRQTSLWPLRAALFVIVAFQRIRPSIRFQSVSRTIGKLNQNSASTDGAVRRWSRRKATLTGTAIGTVAIKKTVESDRQRFNVEVKIDRFRQLPTAWRLSKSEASTDHGPPRHAISFSEKTVSPHHCKPPKRKKGNQRHVVPKPHSLVFVSDSNGGPNLPKLIRISVERRPRAFPAYSQLEFNALRSYHWKPNLDENL